LKTCLKQVGLLLLEPQRQSRRPGSERAAIRRGRIPRLSGPKIVDRFDANAYLAITRTMDTFDPTRGHSSPEAAYRRIQAQVMLVSISSDWLFPAADIAALAASMVEAGVRCQHRELISSHGHDAFLAEPDELARLIRPFLV
jgi:homoserine O-acetyltransferase